MKKDVLFTLPTEALIGAKKVFVLGDFNNWKTCDGFELEIQPDGSAKAYIPLEAGKIYRYRFLVNDTQWVNDYHAERYEPVQGYSVDNCVITVTEIEGGPKASKEKKTAAKKSATPKKATTKKTTAKATANKTKKKATTKPKSIKATAAKSASVKKVSEASEQKSDSVTAE